MDDAQVRKAIEETLHGVDEDALEYFQSFIVGSSGSMDEEELGETLVPFIESYGLAEDEDAAKSLCATLCAKLRDLGVEDKSVDMGKDGPQMLNKAVTMNSSLLSAAEQDALNDSAWGFSAIRATKNDVIDTDEEGNYIDLSTTAKDERKMAKEEKKWLKELDERFGADEDAAPTQISTMTLPDLTSKRREKDIQVMNFNINYGGKLLLESADLKLAYGRRYGLVGRNGIGKTSLLKKMARFDIEGFPVHHRVLHVKQEVSSSEASVLEVVLASDVERTNLLNKEKQIIEQQKILSESESDLDDTHVMENLNAELQQTYERMEQIGVATAESRAAEILTGLRFTEAMQHASTDSLSGGWRMRVALAGALLIQPDLLMLDEPTNHLDLEAVLWLENYLQSYPHTILLVSHDRAFLNEVCTDIIRFADLKLTYYKGNYDIYEGTRKEMLLVQQRQYEAQRAKVAHMQEFVDKFRFNAKRASLVQSRIKAIEKEERELCEAVVDEREFSFSFLDAGQLGRPIIQIEGVTFGYDQEAAPLFKDAHLNLDQSSRVALVGPNGAGKSTLLNLIQGKIIPWDGIIRVNPSLKIAVFTQHHMDSFDLSKSPLQNMCERWPLEHEQVMRTHLGKFEVQGDDAIKPMKFSSGGQKSRVAFAMLTFSKPHLLMMDEPTNHLDLGAIDALATALKSYTGGVMIISHDQHFITNVCNEIWQVKDNRIDVWKDSFLEYKKAAIAELQALAGTKK